MTINTYRTTLTGKQFFLTFLVQAAGTAFAIWKLLKIQEEANR